jgi:hypothetical protein
MILGSENLASAVQADHLTVALGLAGVLGDANVREVVVESSLATIVSRIIRVRLPYDHQEVGASASMILKSGLPERDSHGWDAVAGHVAGLAGSLWDSSGDLVEHPGAGHDGC